MLFTAGFTWTRLAFTALKYALITGVHAAVLLLMLYLDNNFILSETALALFSIPIGLINCALLLNAFMRLKSFNWISCAYFIFIGINFVLYIVVTHNMYSQSGPVIN